MSSAARQERERLAKRTLILNAARELLITRGVEAVTLREIAQRIEYSTTAIYVQFKDKQDLLEQMVREDLGAFSRALLAKAAIADPVQRLDALGEAYVEFALTMPRHYQMLFLTETTQQSQDPARQHKPAPGDEGYELLLHTVEECVQTGRFRPELRDPPALAQAIWASVHGLVSLLIVKGNVPFFEWRQPKQLLEVGLGSLVRGMLAEPPPARAVKRAAAKRRSR